MTHVEHVPHAPVSPVVVARKLDAAAWGLFFVWVGIALIADVGWGLALLGVGIITLGAQVARRSFGLSIEGFWVFVGLCFFLGGIWELLDIRYDLVPIVAIVAGIALLLYAIRRVKA